MIVGNEEKSEQIKENDATVNIMKRKHIVVRVIIFTMIIVVLSGLYLVYAWNRYQDVAETSGLCRLLSTRSNL